MSLFICDYLMNEKLVQLALQRLRRLMEENRYDEEKGSRRQDMEIYYSFVGKIDLPEA